ncbi:MAG: hypothetical protein K9M45_08500, partial [Kiritimatiellales bacterium]|nr:hypothetical protein [Kiritimatiellales bacterium]
MKHINADQLRQYKFGLLSETEAAETAAHLEACDACRQKFQALEKQFQALEVLRDQPEVSEETLEAVLAKGRASKVITFRPVAIRQWKPALATAALLAICFAVLKYAPSEPGTEKDEVRRDTAMESVPADSLMVAEAAPAKEERASGDPLVASRFRTEFQDANDPISHLHKCEINELRSKKPFAPASNIELNVLPRRDEVQVTIYNEED